MFTTFQLCFVFSRVGAGSAACLKARLIGLETLPAPLLDERKAGADAARSYGEDGTAPASSPRLVIRGESPGPGRLALLQVRDGA